MVDTQRSCPKQTSRESSSVFLFTMWRSRPLAREQEVVPHCKLAAQSLPLGAHRFWGNPSTRAISHPIGTEVPLLVSTMPGPAPRHYGEIRKSWRKHLCARSRLCCQLCSIWEQILAPGASLIPASCHSPAIFIYLVYLWKQNVFYTFCTTLGEAASSKAPHPDRPIKQVSAVSMKPLPSSKKSAIRRLFKSSQKQPLGET